MSDTHPFVNIKSPETPYLVQRGPDYYEYQMPVSAKGVLLRDDTVLLVGNSRGELELPGGKLEVGESPAACVCREIEEETGVKAQIGAIVHAWVYPILPSRHVFVVAYGVRLEADTMPDELSVSPEVGHAGWVSLATLDSVNLPEDYRTAIREWIRVFR